MPTISGGAPEWRAPAQGFDVDLFSAAQERAGEPGWAWAPYAPEEPVELARYRIEEWAPASTVRHPWVRVGRFTLLYRRAA
ncbi:hypothetical protein SAMN05660662_1992 [Blastococcus aurantiacus]|uniref:Uncharacterized protein n=1 Tax=Blastococcus aurantiacus TaxID=1550231 RepID=A0A1G7KPA3_9ACTN|nr:hypothetical protein [Blastococcus aurantiacus]SDF39015.1 hypothetical protein SAMN05660662_1992 [Blastococcus aurantiacus]